MRIIKKMILLLSAVFLLCGCMAGAGDYLAYAEGEFSAALEGISGEFEFTAEVAVGAPRRSEDGRPLPRNISMTFVRPAGMQGITVIRQGGGILITSGDLTIDGSRAAGWLALACLLVPEGKAVDARLVGKGGEKLGAVEIITPGGSTVVYVDCATGHPVRIVSDSGGVVSDVRVVSFTYMGE